MGEEEGVDNSEIKIKIKLLFDHVRKSFTFAPSKFF
jgi:hypothetical protein